MMVLPINVRLAIAMLLLIKGTLSQDPTATVDISDNIKKFAESVDFSRLKRQIQLNIFSVYGFATQIMNFGGNFIDGGSAGNSNRRSPTAFVDGMPTVPIKMGGELHGNASPSGRIDFKISSNSSNWVHPIPLSRLYKLQADIIIRKQNLTWTLN
jgi:hypothetical protein